MHYAMILLHHSAQCEAGSAPLDKQAAQLEQAEACAACHVWLLAFTARQGLMCSSLPEHAFQEGVRLAISSQQRRNGRGNLRTCKNRKSQNGTSPPDWTAPSVACICKPSSGHHASNRHDDCSLTIVRRGSSLPTVNRWCSIMRRRGIWPMNVICCSHLRCCRLICSDAAAAAIGVVLLLQAMPYGVQGSCWCPAACTRT